MLTCVCVLPGRGLVQRRLSANHLLRSAALVGVSGAALTLAISPIEAQEVIDGGQVVTVPGDHVSPWNLGMDLIVGDTGAGTLVVDNGGIVTAGVVSVGNLDGSNGAIDVSGAGSALNSAGAIMVVGLDGTGEVTVSSGASLDTAGNLVLGQFDGSDGTLSVTGEDTDWTTANEVTVGASGTGTVNVTDGASVAHGGNLTLGLTASNSGYVTVSGAGTTWNATQDVVVGDAGNGTLWVEDGAIMDAAQTLAVADDTTGSGYVTVRGAGSQLTFGTLNAGINSYAYFWVEEGGVLGSAGHDANFGVGVDGEAGMLMTGAGSRFIANIVTFGEAGKAVIAVSDGARLETGVTTLGNQAGSVGEVHLTGAGTVWANTVDDIFIGGSGEGIVNAAGGAKIDAVSYVRLGNDANGIGSLTLAGAGTSLNAGVSIEIAKAGLGEVIVEEGASLTHGHDLLIGQSAGAMGFATVDGAGSSWQGLGSATIGEAGTGTFIVSDGGSVSIAQNTVLGAAGGGGLIAVDGGSFATGTLVVGDVGGGTLFVENGGAISVGNGGGVVDVAVQAGSQGFVSIGNGAGAGTLDAAMVRFGAGNGNLFFAHTDTDYRFDPIIEGNADIEHGGGHTTLTADSSNFTGTTTIWGGTLSVDGVLGGIVNVDADGTLGGSGTVGDVTVASGGIVAPGNSIGTLNVDNVVFDPGSELQVEVDGQGNADLVNASGTATINGGHVAVSPLPDIVVETPYTIVTAAGGLTGNFDTVAFGSGSLFITPTLTSDLNNAYVTLAQTTDFADVALTPNQKAAAGGIQSVGGGEVFSAIAVLGTAEEARTAFDSISGEIHASAKTAIIEDSRFVREAAVDRLRSIEDGEATGGFGYWGHAFGSHGEIDGDGNAAGIETSTGGFIAGGDAMVDDWRLGLLAGYGQSGFDTDERQSSGNADNYHLGLYGGTEWGNLAFRSGLAYTWHDVETNREVALVNQTLTADYGARTIQAFGELGYRFDIGTAASFEPYANLSYINLATDGFTEAGGSGALTSAGNTTDAGFTTIGVRVSTEIALGETPATLHGGIGWRHAFADDPKTINAFAGGDGFTILGTPIAQDTALIEAGLDLSFSPTTSLGFSYKGQFGSGAEAHVVNGRLGVKF